MRKYGLVLALICALCFVGQSAFANNDNTLIGSGTQVNGNNNQVGGTSNSGSITANGGAGGQGGIGIGTGIGLGGSVGNITVKPEINTNIGNGFGNFSPSAKVDLEFRPTNNNFNSQKNVDIQGQIGINKQNNEQVIAPNQEVTINTPRALLPIVPGSVPELNFGNGKMTDETKKLPAFAIGGITPLAGETIVDVLDVNANVKFKNLYKEILSAGKKIAQSNPAGTVKYQVIRAEAQKTWNTGGNIGGAGSGLMTSGGAGGSVNLIPSFGGTKADDLFTIIFVKVYTAPATVLYQAPVKAAPKATASPTPKTSGTIGDLTPTPRTGFVK